MIWRHYAPNSEARYRRTDLHFLSHGIPAGTDNPAGNMLGFRHAVIRDIIGAVLVLIVAILFIF